MSRTRAIGWTPVRAAKELAQQARSLGGDDRAALAVFRHFWKDKTLQRLLTQSQPAGDAVSPAGLVWEFLLRELASGRRRQRGMYFTPRPLVGYMVNRIEHIVRRSDIGGPLHVIDPACGYGGFLLEAGRQLPAARLTGIEICKSTRLVARMLCGLELQSPPRLIHANPLLAGESLRAAIVGTPDAPLVPVIVGNPPWSNFGRLNRGPWIDRLLADYRSGLGERKTNLADDSIKFIRWAQYWVEQAGRGIVAFVTPNTWLEGLTHRRMRQSVLETFDEVQVVDLGGGSAGEEDENVFGVRSGVAIVLLVRQSRERPPGRSARCAAASLLGSRSHKFAVISNTDSSGLNAREVHPAAPDWRFTARSERRGSTARAKEYASYWPLDRIFRHYTSGVQTKNDAVFVGFTPEQVTEQVQSWLAEQDSAPAFDARHIRPYLLAPFDRRFVYYDPRVLGRARLSVMRHMLHPNLGLVFMRQSTSRGPYDHFLAVDCLVSDRVFYSRHGAPFLAPLWLGEEGSGFGVRGSGDGEQGTGDRGQRTGNFEPQFLEAMTESLGTSACEPLPVFHYLYAVAYSPTYRTRFAEQLRGGFPRFPLPAGREPFLRLSELGGRLVALHAGSTACDDDSAVGGEIFRLGGYDVLRRWARPRQAAGLSADDERELLRLTSIGCQTRQLMQKIDRRGHDHWSAD